MGGNIVIKLPKGKDPNAVMQKVQEVLIQAGYKNITFNVKRKPVYSNVAQDLNSALQLAVAR